MKTQRALRALLAGGLPVAMLALVFALPVMANEDAKPPSESDTTAAAAPAAEASADATAAASTEADSETGEKPSAVLELASEQMRLIMGGTAGKGTLHFNGADYPFTFKSASAGLGMKMVKEVSAVGEVFGLTKIEDFEGQYTALSQAAMAGTKEVHATYKNDKGVVVKLHGTVKGAGLSMGAGIATIKLVKE